MEKYGKHLLRKVFVYVCRIVEEKLKNHERREECCLLQATSTLSNKS